METLDVRELRELVEKWELQELQEWINKLLRLFEGEKAFDVTSHGKVIAHVVPVSETKRPAQQDLDASWVRMDQIAAEIGVSIPDTTVDAVEIIRDVRRDL